MISTVAQRGEIFSLRERQMPLYRLAELFQIPDVDAVDDAGMVIVVESGGRQFGLLVDSLIGLQQTVIKSLGQSLGPVSGITGGAIMADGNVGLIVDINAIVAMGWPVARPTEAQGLQVNLIAAGPIEEEIHAQ